MKSRLINHASLRQDRKAANRSNEAQTLFDRLVVSLCLTLVHVLTACSHLRPSLPTPFFFLFLRFSLFSSALAYFQLFRALIRLRARNAGRSDFARLAENDLLIAEETSFVDVHPVPKLFPLLNEEDSYGRR